MSQVQLAALGDSETLASGDVPAESGCGDVKMEDDQDVKSLRSLPAPRVYSFLCAGCLS